MTSLSKLIRSMKSKISAAAAAKSLQSCPTLCDPRDSSLPGSPVPGILQARTLEWVVISFSNAWKWKVKVKSLSRVQPSATPSVHGIFQARVLEWGAIAFSENLSRLCLKKIFFDELILKCIRKLKQNPRIAKTAKITLKRKNGVGEF